MLKPTLLAALLAFQPCILFAAEPPASFEEHINALTSKKRGTPIRLKNGDAATTEASFKPPVEIVIEAKVDAPDLRIELRG